MKWIILFLFSTQWAFAECLERYYTEEHLNRYKNQELRDVQFSWNNSIEYFAEMGKEGAMQVHLVRNGEHLVGEAQVKCPVDYWSSDFVKIKCEVLGQDGSIQFEKKEGRKGVLATVSPKVRFQVVSRSGKGSLSLPAGDRKFYLYENKKRHYASCEDILFDVHRLTAPRLWNEVLMYSIRNDLARPTVTARNLYHFSSLLWDVYAAFDDNKKAHMIEASVNASPLKLSVARDEALHFAAYTLLSERYKNAPGNLSDTFPDPELTDGEPDQIIQIAYDRVMKKLGYFFEDGAPKARTTGAKFGRTMALRYIEENRNDGSRESENHRAIPGELTNPNAKDFLDYSQSGIRVPFADQFDVEAGRVEQYEGAGTVFADRVSISHWLPLFVNGSLDQGGNDQNSEQAPLTLFWGKLPTFADLTKHKSATKPGVYFDPESEFVTFEENREEFIKQNLQVLEVSGLLSPKDLVADKKDFDRDGRYDENKGIELIDISPGTLGNNTLGTNNGKGHPVNPVTGQPYPKNWVKKADYYRSIAEFWADGPSSETPPGHWNVIANYTMDQLAKSGDSFLWRGEEQLSQQEYELRTYLTLNGALHDAAVVAWGIKGHYEGGRPIVVLRKFAHMVENDPAFAKEISTYTDKIKLVEYEKKEDGKTTRVKKAIAYGWRGHHFIGGDFDGGAPDLRDKSFRQRDPIALAEEDYYLDDWQNQVAGTGWILLDNWMPYQRQSFVTPPFPGFVSGHSTFSRAAAEVLAYTTGSKYFPGGLGTYKAPELHFEASFEEPFEFQWATFYDASDASGLSRIYGGIHASYDDLPARKIGSKVGIEATKKAKQLFQ